MRNIHSKAELMCRLGKLSLDLRGYQHCSYIYEQIFFFRREHVQLIQWQLSRTVVSAHQYHKLNLLKVGISI